MPTLLEHPAVLKFTDVLRVTVPVTVIALTFAPHVNVPVPETKCCL